MNETILVVDDTSANLEVMSELLTAKGFQVIVAEDGATCLELAGTCPPDLILLDIMMPEMDGFDTCLKLKQRPETRDIPVLFMTARADTGDKVRGFNLGAVDYITKPYQEEEVIARVVTHITLARQMRALETSLAERNRFMNIAAHDLRNPLTAIIGWSQLGELSQSPVEARNIFATIERAANQIKAIIEDFLALQVLKSKGTEQAERIDLGAIITQVIQQNAGNASRKRVSVSWQPPAQPALAHANPVHMHQILTNYLSNAIKYSPENTAVTLFATEHETAWKLTVKDQGPGIPADERGKLFLEFAKISNRPREGEISTGLGLSIVKALAVAQRGMAGADFPAEGGSEFWVAIPKQTTA